MGYLHLDIKPENILVNCDDFSHPDSSKLHLIDYGLSVSYLDAHNNHIRKERATVFRGSVLTASKNAFSYNQSRRDDIISMLYLLMYLLRGRLPW